MDVLVKVVPVALIFFLGVLLRTRGLAKKEDGEFLLRLNFFVALPALTILGLASADLHWNLAYFPLIGTISILVNLGLVLAIRNRLPFDRQTMGVFFLTSAIINSGFTLPFLIAAYGQEGLVRKIIFDLATDTLSFTLMYYIACRFGHKKQNGSFIAKKILLSPALISVIIGITLNVWSVKLPQVAVNFLTPLSALVMVSILLALGIYFKPSSLSLPRVAFLPLAIRTLAGLAVGLLLVKFLNLQGVDKGVAIVLASAPVGYVALTLASLEKLNVEYAATIASVSAFAGTIYIPILLVFLA